MDEIEALIARLGLGPLPVEGGWFVESHRSAASTAIYYLLTPDTFSAIHRLGSEEVFHFYSGDPVEMLLLYPEGLHRTVTLGSDVLSGQSPQVVVPAGVWQGCRLVAGGRYALMGTTVAPPFSFDVYQAGQRDDLIRQYPDCEEMIRALTRV